MKRVRLHEALSFLRPHGILGELCSCVGHVVGIANCHSVLGLKYKLMFFLPDRLFSYRYSVNSSLRDK